MKNFIREYHVAILIGISFYMAGWAVTATTGNLSGRDIVVSLVAGAVCGLTVLTVNLMKALQSRQAASVGKASGALPQ